MSGDQTVSKERTFSIILRSILIPVIILAVAGGGFEALKSFRHEPVQTPYSEPEIDVELMTAKVGKAQTSLSGYGTIRSRRIVQITPEVSGRVVKCREPLEDGNIVEKGDILFKLDARDYQAASDLQVAEKERILAEIELLKTTKKNNQALLALREDGLKLAEKEYERLKNLLKEKGIGSQQVLEAAKLRAINANERVVQLKNELNRDPIRLKSLNSQIKRVEAQLLQSQLAVDRCTVKAPFHGRLMHVQIEKDQLVGPTRSVMSIIDDSQREIEVSLKADDVIRWLPFVDGRKTGVGWFRPLQPIAAKIQWVEASEVVHGVVDRISRIDESTRTAYVVVLIPQKTSEKLVLVPGMFCRVEIPGKTIPRAITIPQHALSAEGMVLIDDGGRLAMRAVQMIRQQGSDAILAVPTGDPPQRRKWLKPGDRLITSTVLAPIEGQKVRERGTKPSKK